MYRSTSILINLLKSHARKCREGQEYTLANAAEHAAEVLCEALRTRRTELEKKHAQASN